MGPVIGSPPVNATNIGACEAHNAAHAAGLAGAAGCRPAYAGPASADDAVTSYTPGGV